MRLQDAPRASVIVVASGGAPTLAKLIGLLRGQTIAPQLEVIIATWPDLVADHEATETGNLHSIKVFAHDLRTSASARYAALSFVTAPAVVLAEDHAFPKHADWAERMVEGVEAGHAAVGPVVGSANPATALSWANLCLEYGIWLWTENTTARTVDRIPGHNSCYSRDALLHYGEDLEDLLEVEWMIHKDMRERGLTLLLDPQIVVEHLNLSVFGKSLKIHLIANWIFAAKRSADWNPLRRIAYGLGFPAIIAVRFWRCNRIIGNLPDLPPGKPRTRLMTLLCLSASGLGEGFGYLTGTCGMERRLGPLEFFRWKGLQADEVPLILDEGPAPAQPPGPSAAA